MRNGSDLAIYVIVGAIIGLAVFLGGLNLLQNFADWILSLDPLAVGGIGAFIGGVAGFVLGIWKNP